MFRIVRNDKQQCDVCEKYHDRADVEPMVIENRPAWICRECRDMPLAELSQRLARLDVVRAAERAGEAWRRG